MIEAFYYMFKDNKFVQKAVGYFGFSLLANVIAQWSNLYLPVVKGAAAPPIYYILSFLGFIALFIPSGYSISCIKAIMEQKENPVLPYVNIKNNFILGFKLMTGIILLSLVLFIMFIITVVGLSIVAATVSKALASLILFTISIIIFLVILFYSPILSCIFAKKEWYTTFFRLIRATEVIGNGIGTYFKGIGLFIVTLIPIVIISGMTGYFLNMGFAGALLSALIISLINSYVVYVFSYIAVKSVKYECIE